MMAERITFDINGGDIQVWEQDGHDSDVSLYRMIESWERNDEIKIPADDMVMLGNLYREIKEQDIKNPFLNYYGKNKLATDDDVSAALQKQIKKKPKKAAKNSIRYAMGYVCPNCEKHFTGTGIAAYCYHCGQALDWSDYIDENNDTVQ